MVRFFLNKVPLEKSPVIQNGTGIVYGVTRNGPFEAVPIQQFDKHKPSKGYKKFTECSHAYSSITKGYTFPLKPLKGDLQLAYDFKGKAGSRLTADHEVQIIGGNSTLGFSSYVVFRFKDIFFYAVHAKTSYKKGQRVPIGKVVVQLLSGNSHLHLYCTRGGKQLALKSVILEAIPKDLPEVQLPPVVQPELPKEEQLPQVDSKLEEENQRLKDENTGLRNKVSVMESEHRAEVEQLNATIERQTAVIDELIQENTDLQVHNDDLSRALELAQQGKIDLDTIPSQTLIDRLIDRNHQELIISTARKLMTSTLIDNIVLLVKEFVTKLRGEIRQD